MPANFPATPAVNDVYSYSGSTWIWTGVYWQLQNSQLINGVSFTYSNTAPSAANLGDRWLNSDTLQELVLVSDGTSTQWVEIASQAPTGATRNLNNLANVAINTSLVPAANVTYDLGSSSLRWRDLYLSGNSLIIGAATITASGSAIALPVGSTVGNTTFGSGSLTTEDLTVSGNLTVNGTTTTINSTTLSIDDKNIVLADGAANSAAADGAGITVAGASATLTYVSASDTWNVNKNILITPGTANGVMYLNASKVATTGSALTFNGTTTLSVSSSLNGASNYIRVINSSNTANSGALLSIQTGGTSGGTAAIEYYNQTTAIYAGATTSYANYFVGANPDGTTPYFAANSTGFGIGTTTPTFSTVDGYAQRGIHITGTKENGTAPVIRLSETGSGRGNWEIRSNRYGLSSGNLFQIAEATGGTFLTIRGDDDAGSTGTTGYVGIGTDSPTAMLHIKGPYPYIKFEDTGDTGSITDPGLSGTITQHQSGNMYYDANNPAKAGASGGHIFRANGAANTLMTIDAGGNMSLNGSNYNTASSTGITIADHGNNYDLGSLQGYIKFVGRYWSGDDNIGGAGAMIGAQKGSANGYTGTQLAFYTTEQGASSPNQNSQKMVLTGNGRLGIGTNSPNARLEVYPGTITGSSSQEILRLDIPGNDIFSTATGYINFRGYDLSNSTQRDVAYIGVELVANTGSTPYMGGIIKFNTCASGASTSVIERARITSTGDLLVGTTSGLAGGYRLIVNGTAFTQTPTSSDIYQGHTLIIQEQDGTNFVANKSIALGFNMSCGGGFTSHGKIALVKENGTSGNQSTRFEFWTRNGANNGTSDAERLRISSTGSLGVYGSVSVSSGTHTLSDLGSSPHTVRLYNNTDSNNSTNRFLLCDAAASVLRAEIRSNGGFANYSANNANLSDRREKTNFAPAKSYLDTICAIPVQTFNYIDQAEDDPGLTLGVVAQDVQAVAPELVMESNWGTEDNPKMRLSIYQTDLQYALMKALQELKAEFDAYKAAHP